MKIKATYNINTLGDVDGKKEIVLEKEDRIKLVECLLLVKELYNAVIKEEAVVPATETHIWMLLSQTAIISRQLAMTFNQTEK